MVRLNLTFSRLSFINTEDLSVKCGILLMLAFILSVSHSLPKQSYFTVTVAILLNDDVQCQRNIPVVLLPKSSCDVPTMRTFRESVYLEFQSLLVNKRF